MHNTTALFNFKLPYIAMHNKSRAILSNVEVECSTADHSLGLPYEGNQ